MHDIDCSALSDRQARAVILAAETLGFEREPDLYEAWYDLDLHEDAQLAVRHLQAHDTDALRDALVADEPIPADRAADRIANSGRFTYADAHLVLELAIDRGFAPPVPDLPFSDRDVMWNQARAAVAFLWDHYPALLTAQLGDTQRIAPLPETARNPRDYRLVGRRPTGRERALPSARRCSHRLERPWSPSACVGARA